MAISLASMDAYDNMVTWAKITSISLLLNTTVKYNLIFYGRHNTVVCDQA